MNRLGPAVSQSERTLGVVRQCGRGLPASLDRTTAALSTDHEDAWGPAERPDGQGGGEDTREHSCSPAGTGAFRYLKKQTPHEGILVARPTWQGPSPLASLTCTFAIGRPCASDPGAVVCHPPNLRQCVT